MRFAKITTGLTAVLLSFLLLVAASPKEIKDFSTGVRLDTDWVLLQTAAGATQKYSVGTLVESSYGELYEDAAGGGTSITTGTSYVKWVSATVGETAGADIVSGSAASDDLTIGTRGGGVIWVTLDVSFSGSANETFDVCVHLNGTCSHIRLRRKLGTGGDVGAAAVTGLLTLVPADVVDVRVKSLLASKTFTPDHIGFAIARVSL